MSKSRKIRKANTQNEAHAESSAMDTRWWDKDHGEKEVRRLEKEFMRLHPDAEYVSEWIRNDPEWAKTASSIVGALHNREVAMTQSVTRKSHFILTTSFVALGAIGWLLTNLLGNTPLTELQSTNLRIICLTTACLSGIFLLLSIWWALRAIRPIVFSDIDVKDALRLTKNYINNKQGNATKEVELPDDLQEICSRTIYLDWECSYVRNKLNEGLFSAYSSSWHSFMIGIVFLSISWFSGLIYRM